jgi:hydrogenase nickel incorporation protein HypB
MMKVVEPGEGEILDIELDEDLLKRNRELAVENRRLLDQYKVHAIDVMGSIGSGKTSLITQLVTRLMGKHRMAAIAGDLTTSIDAERISSSGASVIQINTGRECHLDANLVKKAISELNLEGIDLLFIENVGNLICPADFPLGSHQRIVVISVTEGPYIVVKHPFIFIDADAVAINKIDLAQAMDVKIEQLEVQLLAIKPALKVARINCLTGEGIEGLIKVLEL